MIADSSGRYIPERDFSGENPIPPGLDLANVLKIREKQIEDAAIQGEEKLTRDLCNALQQDALKNALTARVLRDRNLYLIEKTKEYIESNWNQIPAGEIARMGDELEQAEQKTWREFRAHKNYYKNYLPDFINEQMRITNDRANFLGRYLGMDDAA